MHELPLEGISSPPLEINKLYLHRSAGDAAELMAALDGRCAYVIANVPSDVNILRFCETWSNFILRNHNYLSFNLWVPFTYDFLGSREKNSSQGLSLLCCL